MDAPQIRLILLLLALVVLPPCLSAQNEYYKFTSTEGNQIEARIVEVKPNVSVTIERRDGMVFRDVPLERFSKIDRDHIDGWLEKERMAINDARLTADSPIKLSFKRGQDDDKNDYGDIDDRVITFTPAVTIENRHLEKTYKDVEGVVVIIGKGVINDKQLVILDRQSFEVTLPPKERIQWKAKSFEARYDPDYGGAEYAGYLIVLKNRDSAIVLKKGSKSVWEKNPKLVLRAKKFTGYNSDFTETSRLHTTWGLPR